MKALSERIAFELETVFAGTYAIRELLTEEICKAIADKTKEELLPQHIYDAIDKVYPINYECGKNEQLKRRVLNIITGEIVAYGKEIK